MPEYCGSIRKHRRNKFGNVLSKLGDSVSTRDVTGFPVSTQVNGKHVESRRELSQYRRERLPVSRKAMQQDQRSTILWAFGEMNRHLTRLQKSLLKAREGNRSSH